MESGTTQKTEGFELSTGSSLGKRENWVLGCGGLFILICCHHFYTYHFPFWGILCAFRELFEGFGELKPIIKILLSNLKTY